MKKLKFMLLSVAIAGFMGACSNDDDNGDSTGGNIEARWTPTKTVVEVGADDYTTEYTGNEVGCGKDYIEFAADGTFNNVIYFRNASDACTADMATPANWSKNDDTLIITDGEYEGTYEIVRLTGSDLRVRGTSTVGGSTTITTVYFTKVAS